MAEAASEGVTLLTSTNQSGFLNVCKDKAQWIARVTRDGKEVTIARCDTAEEAALAVARSPEGRASEAAIAQTGKNVNPVPRPRGLETLPSPPKPMVRADAALTCSPARQYSPLAMSLGTKCPVHGEAS